MKILITGAAGFVGFHLSRRLMECGDTVIGLDSLNDYYDPRLKEARLARLGIGKASLRPCKVIPGGAAGKGSFSFMHAGLEDRSTMEDLFQDHAFDVVCNLAAQAGVRYSMENPRAYVDSNLVGFINVLECCRTAAVPHLVYASSSSVYGLGAARPFSTHSRVDHPISLYAATKRANELMAHTYSHLYRLPATGLRFFTVYGPWGRPDMAYFKFAEAIMEGREIDVYNGGDMLRDFTYIDDIVDGLARIIDKPPAADPGWDPTDPDPASSSAPWRIYNLGNCRPVRLTDFIAELERCLGKVARKRFLPMQPGDVRATEAEVSDLERDFGWKPSTGIREGLASFSEWFLRYRAGKA